MPLLLIFTAFGLLTALGEASKCSEHFGGMFIAGLIAVVAISLGFACLCVFDEVFNASTRIKDSTFGAVVSILVTLGVPFAAYKLAIFLMAKFGYFRHIFKACEIEF